MTPPGEEVSVEHLEKALLLAAYVVLRYGEAYAPLLERLEHEVVERRRRVAPADRARRILEAYTLEGGRKAILLSQSRF
jgi:hypothetical protein